MAFAGAADLGQNTVGVLFSDLGFDNQQKRVAIRRLVQGPRNGDYDEGVDIDAAHQPDAPCGGATALRVATRVEVVAVMPRTQGALKTRSDGFVTHNFRIDWTACR